MTQQEDETDKNRNKTERYRERCRARKRLTITILLLETSAHRLRWLYWFHNGTSQFYGIVGSLKPLSCETEGQLGL